MIWKEEDVINLAKGKNAIQSSISKWSHIDDANRAINYDLGDINFAFHTGWEDNPYWMIDLENIEPIDCIRITNRKEDKYKKINKNLKVEYSIDNISWMKIDPNMHEWRDLDILEINVFQAIKARYIKIYLNATGHLVLKKIEIFKRKYNYVLGSRIDALGMRILALINAMYAAKELGSEYKFMFSWWENTDVDYLDTSNANASNHCNFSQILKDNEIFSDDFLKEHLISHHFHSYRHDINSPSFNETKDKFLVQKWGFHASGNVPLCEVMSGINPELALDEMSKCYKEIQWSDRCAKIIKDIDYICNEIISGSFIAIHIRGGEIVLGEFKIAPEVWMRSRHFPYEIAIELAKMEWDKNNIIIIGQDFIANQILEEYLNKIKPNKSVMIYSIDSLIEGRFDYENKERSFFDMNFLSRAEKIYATGISAFSNVANMIAGKQLVCSFFDIYSLEEIYNIIEKNINCIDIGNLHRAYCYYRLCSYARRLKKPIDTSRQWLTKAINEDPNNSFYKVIMTDLWFEEKELKKADEYLKSCVFEESFFEAIYGLHTCRGFAKGAASFYEYIRNQYTQFASMEYPYISYVAAKISIFRKNADEALKFITYSLKAEPNNNLFISTHNEIAKLFPGQSPTLPKPEIIQPQKQANDNAQELQTSQDTINSLNNQINTLNNQLNTLNTEINSYPIKKQSLEISNLEQDLINKTLKAQLSKLNQEFETNNTKSKLENQKLQKINADLYFALNYGTAKSRIKNQLSYKLGQAMILNSKSIWGYIRMPYILSYIKETHQKEQKLYQEKIKANPSLKLPPIESYPDYKEALKEKECLTYKLGEAMIEADKSSLKLGYLTLWFKCKNITKEHKDNHKNSPNNPNH
ncbi:discoidin domain-containing protein [Campylobacter devanensis]|uniref:discoidin domain-containing protein n=1 Tax=Campylobacter devanensis TaxID=3161138 RepID=UPI0015D7088D|nr:discoidin domain-containing protein [Campylobacter sp. P0108]